MKNLVVTIHLLLCLLSSLASGQAIAIDKLPENGYLSGEQIHRQVNRFIRQQYAGQAVRVQVEWFSHLEHWYVGKVDSIAPRYRQSRLPAGHSVISLQAYRKGQVVRRLNCSVNIRLFARVAVLADDIPAGQVISKQQLLFRDEEITTLRGKPVREEENVSNLSARRYLRKGSIVTREMLTEPVVIHRGETITLLYEAPPVHIKMKVKALQNGAPGDVIWFRNPDNRKRLKGKVVDGSFALVTP